MISYCTLVRARQPYALCFRRVEVGPIPTPSSPEYLENVRKKVIWGTPRANDKTLLSFITWLCLCQKTGNYRIYEFDWLKSILNAVKIFRSRTVTFCNEVKSCNWSTKNRGNFVLKIFIYGSAKKHDEKNQEPLREKLSKADEQTLADLSSNWA